MPPTLPRWLFREHSQSGFDQPSLSPDELEPLSEELGISALLASILNARGFRSRTAMDTFLSPGLRYLHPIEDWPGLEDAAKLLARAALEGDTIAVWGDYDVDGITATALVKDFFTRRGYTVLHHLPNRLQEGYGMNVSGVEQLAEQNVRCLITVDCGIADIEPIRRARELGMTVIVTDHHIPGEQLPPAHAILNPRMGTWPCCDLAGVGVAFFLAAGLNRVLPGTALDIRIFLDLVALGTVADVVKLSEQNRILVKNGLLLLKEGRRPGIRALKKSCKLQPEDAVGAGTIGFGLAPRINAAGRLGSPDLALELLLAESEEAARPLAQRLEKMNIERKSLEQQTLEEAVRQAEAMPDSRGLVLYSPNWHPGVIGIVASRIVDAFHRPCLLLAKDTQAGQLKGSGRSIPEFDLHAGLRECRHLLTRFGGHRLAAGAALAEAQLPDLREAFSNAVSAQLGTDVRRPSLSLDGRLGFEHIDLPLIQELELLEPVGPGNPRPVFLSPRVKVLQQKFLSRGKHLDLTLRDENSGVILRGVLWREGEKWHERSLQGSGLLVAFTPKQSAYRGLCRIELTIRAILEVTPPQGSITRPTSG
jgi:single-stranded-DNA-specific exonuclease